MMDFKMELQLIILFIPAIMLRTVTSGKIHKDIETKAMTEFLRRRLQETAIFKSGLAIGSLSVGGKGDCKDEVTWCADYAPRYCYHSYLKTNCKMTCNECPVVEDSTCIDKHPDCSIGVGYGYCSGSDSEIDYMRVNCQKSCKFCGSSKSKCEDKQTPSYCHQIKKLNHCRNPQYKEHFKKYCSATCGYCKPSCGISEMRKQAEQTLKDSKEAFEIEIVGGKTAKKGFYPWQVAIYHKDEFLCGGNLIDDAKIITAAHCFNHRSKEVTEYKVVLGEHNRDYDEGTEQNVDVEKIIIHEYYDFDADDHDIAVLILSENARTGQYIYPICLPEVNAALKTGTKCFVTGWGKKFHSGMSVDLLQEVQMPIGDRSYCERRNSFNYHKVTDRMICAGYTDGSSFASGCHGDSGGPLQCEENGQWKLYGVISWGSPLCNGLDRFTVFTRTSKYIDWIKRQN